MKKIVFTIHSMRQLGGAERVLSIISNKLVDKYDITIITISGYDLYHNLDDRVKLIALNMHQKSNNRFDAIKYNIGRIIKLREVLKTIKPDLLISFTITVNITAIIAARMLSIPIIISERSNPWKIEIPHVWRIIGNYIFPLAQAIVVLTDRTKDYFKKYKVPMYKIYNPLMVEDNYKPLSQKERKKVILGVGRLNSIKRFDLLIESFKKLKNRDGWSLILLGDGEEREKLEKLIENLNLTESVFLKGAVSTVDRYMKESSILALTSSHEGFPNVLCEAMMYGMAVVSFDCETGPSEIIDSEVNGILVESGNRKELISNLERLISDIELREQFSQEAIKIKEKLHSDNIIHQWELLIESIISQKGK